MTAGGGLASGKLELANAQPGDVVSGKKFYAGDKEIKTGTLKEMNGWTNAVSLYRSNASTLGANIPAGAYRKTGNGGYPVVNFSAEDVRKLLGAVMSSETHNALSFNTSKACRVLVVWATRNGYKGSKISVTGNGMTNVVSADNCTNQSFGDWGPLYCAGFGYNIPQGTNVTISGSGNINEGCTIEVRYFE